MCVYHFHQWNLISKESTTPCLLQTTKANRGLMGLDVGTGACVGLSSPWRLVFQPSAAVGGPSSQFRHPLTSPLNASSIHLSRLGAWLYIDGGVYKVRQAYDCLLDWRSISAMTRVTYHWPTTQIESRTSWGKHHRRQAPWILLAKEGHWSFSHWLIFQFLGTTLFI